MTIDERLEALTMSAELLLHESQEHSKQLMEHSKQLMEHTRHLEKDAEHIRGVVRIAELHHERLLRLEHLTE